MYKIGQIKVAAPEWDSSTAITGNFEANKIYYLKLDSPLSTDIHLYNVRSDGVSPEESTWQLLKPDYADKTILKLGLLPKNLFGYILQFLIR